MSKHWKTFFNSKLYNKPILYNIKKQIKFLFFEFFRILKCLTTRECVTSQVRKDARGYCTFLNKN